MPVSSLRRLVAAVALIAGFAAVSTPARADDGTTTVGGYTVSTAPTGSPTDPDSYGKAEDPNSYGKADTGTTSTGGATTSAPDSYGKS